MGTLASRLRWRLSDSLQTKDAVLFCGCEVVGVAPAKVWDRGSHQETLLRMSMLEAVTPLDDTMEYAITTQSCALRIATVAECFGAHSGWRPLGAPARGPSVCRCFYMRMSM